MATTHSIDIGPPSGSDPDVLFTQTWASSKTDSLVIGADRAVVITNGVTPGITINGAAYRGGRAQFSLEIPADVPVGTIGVGAGIPFPTSTYTIADSNVIDRVATVPDNTTFQLAGGAYKIGWNVITATAAVQLRVVATTGTIVTSAQTTVGRGVANNQIRGECIIVVNGASARIQLQNVSAGAITLTPGADGGPNDIYSYLTIERI
jgi:hypothetical protein